MKNFTCLRYRHTANRAQYSLIEENLKRLGCSFNCVDHIRFHIRMKADMNLYLFDFNCFLGKQEQSWVISDQVTTYTPRLSSSQTNFSRLAKLVLSWGQILHKVTFSRLLPDRTDFELQHILLFIQNMRPFLIGSKANWCLPYLEDASNIPSI